MNNKILKGVYFSFLMLNMNEMTFSATAPTQGAAPQQIPAPTQSTKDNSNILNKEQFETKLLALLTQAATQNPTLFPGYVATTLKGDRSALYFSGRYREALFTAMQTDERKVLMSWYQSANFGGEVYMQNLLENYFKSNPNLLQGFPTAGSIIADQPEPWGGKAATQEWILQMRDFLARKIGVWTHDVLSGTFENEALKAPSWQLYLKNKETNKTKFGW